MLPFSVDKIIFNHLAIFDSNSRYLWCFHQRSKRPVTTTIVFIEIVAITINSDDFVFGSNRQIEVKCIGLITSDGFAIFAEVIPVVVIIFDKLVVFVRFRGELLSNDLGHQHCEPDASMLIEVWLPVHGIVIVERLSFSVIISPLACFPSSWK